MRPQACTRSAIREQEGGEYLKAVVGKWAGIVGLGLLAVWAVLSAAKAFVAWLIGSPEVFLVGIIVVAIIGSTASSGARR